jgi:Arc/MetJ-type ribon-helix-helix transcriptional regulator
MNSKKHVISIRLPKKVIEELDMLVNLGYFNSRSEAIRHSISFMLMTVLYEWSRSKPR